MVAMALDGLGATASDYEEAEKFYWEAATIYVETLGKFSSEYANVLINIAIQAKNKEDYNRAESLLLKALEIYKVIPEKHYESYIYVWETLFMIHMGAKKYTKAKNALSSLELETKKVFSSLHPTFHRIQRRNIEFLVSTKQYDQVAQKAKETLKNNYDTSFPFQSLENLDAKHFIHKVEAISTLELLAKSYHDQYESSKNISYLYKEQVALDLAILANKEYRYGLNSKTDKFYRIHQMKTLVSQSLSNYLNFLEKTPRDSSFLSSAFFYAEQNNLFYWPMPPRAIKLEHWAICQTL